MWIGKGRGEDTLKRWLQSLSPEQKATIELFAMDMHRAYWNAVDNTRGLEHAAIVHDPFHVMKLAGQMLDELRRFIHLQPAGLIEAFQPEVERDIEEAREPAFTPSPRSWSARGTRSRGHRKPRFFASCWGGSAPERRAPDEPGDASKPGSG